MRRGSSIDDARTRQRVLESAADVFAERGFRAATVRDICRRAGANVAAVNYHFGDKHRLYLEVLRHAHHAAFARYPADLNLPRHATPEQRLAAFVRSLFLKIFGDGSVGWLGKLMSREMVEPSAALDVIVDETIRPHFQVLRKIVRDMLPKGVDEQTLRRCARSIVAQCLFYHHARAVIVRLHPIQKFSPRDIEELADHVTRFSTAALRELARQHKGGRR